MRLTLAAIGNIPTLVYLNRFDPENEVHELNRRWLIEQDHLTVITDVHSLALAIEGPECALELERAHRRRPPWRVDRFPAR